MSTLLSQSSDDIITDEHGPPCQQGVALQNASAAVIINSFCYWLELLCVPSYMHTPTPTTDRAMVCLTPLGRLITRS